MRVWHTSEGGGLHQGQLGLRLSQLWCAVRIGVWLCGLPLRWRMHSLPNLLRHLTPVRSRVSRRGALEMDQAAHLVRRLCRLRLFRSRPFPQACLRQALALYYVLARMGYPVAIHFGVYHNGEALRGHSWVTVDGQPVAERLAPMALQTIYSCAAAVRRTARERSRVDRQH